MEMILLEIPDVTSAREAVVFTTVFTTPLVTFLIVEVAPAEQKMNSQKFELHEFF